MIIPFQYKYLLWLLFLLPIILLVFFYAKNKKKQAFKNIGDAHLVKQLMANYKAATFHQKFILLFFSLAFLLLSLANFRTPTGATNVKRNGIDVMIAIDVSKSMLAQDVQPNRLDRAKQVLNKLIDKLGNDRVGIVVFAGKAYLQMPLTADHSAAKMYLASATPETVPTQGTVIGDALKSCNASFNAKDKKYKAVVLISDGEDHDENAIKVAEQMAQLGVVINTVGIGSPQGATIMDAQTNELKKDEAGNNVITKLNEQALTDIATKGNGKYFFYTSTDEVVNNLYAQLSTLDTKSVTDDSLVNYKSWFQYLLGIALLFLIIEILMSEVKKSNKKYKIAATIFILLCSTNLFAQTENETIKKGNDAYKKQDYNTAATKYETVVKKNEANQVAQFNLGNALYKSDKKDDAIAAYDKAENNAKLPTEKSSALYNKGVALQTNKKQEECIVTYKNALKLDPNNIDARHNLQLALQQQKQQQQKDQQDKKDQNKDKKSQDDNKNKQQEQPKPQQSKLTEKDAAQKLEALSQKEKELQDKFHKVNAASPDKPTKDW